MRRRREDGLGWEAFSGTVGVHWPKRRAETRSSRSLILVLNWVAHMPRSPGEWLSLPPTPGRDTAWASLIEKAFSTLEPRPLRVSMA